MTNRSDETTEAQELLIDAYLLTKGITEQRNPLESKGSGDRIIDGVATEYKTISGIVDPTSDTLSAAVSNRAMNARSQAPHVVIDARAQEGMTEEDAIRGAIGAFGADTKTALKTGKEPKLKSIRVIHLDGSSNATDILIPRQD